MSRWIPPSVLRARRESIRQAETEAANNTAFADTMERVLDLRGDAAQDEQAIAEAKCFIVEKLPQGNWKLLRAAVELECVYCHGPILAGDLFTSNWDNCHERYAWCVKCRKEPERLQIGQGESHGQR